MNWFWPKQKKTLDPNKVYLKIQFLTKEQKVKKDIAIGQVLQSFKYDDQTIIPFEEYFSCSYRFIFNTKYVGKLLGEKIMVKQVIANIILSTDQATKTFYQSYINGIQVIMLNNQSLSNSDLIQLYDQRQISMYNPEQVLQIIYNQKSLWQRIKNRTKIAIKKIPSLISRMVQKMFGFVLVVLGLNGSMSSLLWRAVPSKMILQWLGIIVSVFFPALGPILGITKLIL